MFIKRILLPGFCLIVSVIAGYGQLTLKVTSIPANTPPGAKIYVAGTFNNWNPSDAAKILNLQSDGSYQITFTPPVGTGNFKFTRGGWPSVEGDANGNYLPDRAFTYNGQPLTLDLTILSWEDLGGSNGSTAASNVKVIFNDFYIPQLNRTRRIWLYLPPDYNTTTKRYPVLYMQDGQNLFDVKTSFSGEWKVDESLNGLHSQGDYGCIVVGIDNGGQYRIEEYSPWVNPDYGGGRGEDYINFIINTLKPYIDTSYRTLKGRHTTGIMGSSLGGLISMYGFSERQDIFSKAGIFSSAFWFAGDSSVIHTANRPKKGDARVYFLAGGNEPQYVTTDMLDVREAMFDAGFATQETKVYVPSDGEHSEWFWAREFPEAYKWLFAGVTNSESPAPAEEVEIFPNPVYTSQFRIGAWTEEQSAEYQIIGMDGKVWRDSIFLVNEPIQTGDLPSGAYLIKVREKDGKFWRVGKFSMIRN